MSNMVHVRDLVQKATSKLSCPDTNVDSFAWVAVIL